MTKTLISTKEITVNMNGVEYDCILIPRDIVVDVDYSLVPENHPKIKRLIDKVRRGEPI
ncbi:MAG: hypothetical protein ACOYIP_06920 [Coriobacteriales bacterium]|jgi:hypothetical protein